MTYITIKEKIYNGATLKDAKNINIKAKHINIDTLLMYKDLFKFSKLPVKIQDGKLYSESITGSIYNSKIYLTAYTSDVKLENNILKIKLFILINDFVWL